MSEGYSEKNPPGQPESGWAAPVSQIKTYDVPPGVTNINVDGKEISGAMKGFGQLWKKTYYIRLEGIEKTPEEVMDTWKAHFPEFQPKENRFFPSMGGINPGQVLFIDAVLPFAPGMPKVIPVTSGVMVMYSDRTSFAVTTPEGFPEAGWNNFSIFQNDDGCLIAQVQSFGRTQDPVYEFGYRIMGGARWQEQIWSHVLQSLAGYYGVEKPVLLEKICLESRLQWSEAGNIWQNAMLRTVLYRLAAPFRWVRKRISGSSKSDS